jgi:hypothetical protein
MRRRSLSAILDTGYDKRWAEKLHATSDKHGIWGTLLLIPSERFTPVAIALEKLASRPNGYSPLLMTKSKL